LEVFKTSSLIYSITLSLTLQFSTAVASGECLTSIVPIFFARVMESQPSLLMHRVCSVTRGCIFFARVIESLLSHFLDALIKELNIPCTDCVLSSKCTAHLLASVRQGTDYLLTFVRVLGVFCHPHLHVCTYDCTCAGRVLPPTPTCLHLRLSHNRLHLVQHSTLPCTRRWLHAPPRNSPNAVAWIGTESGHAPYPVWNTQDGCSSGAGTPFGKSYVPKEVDLTLQNSDTWFYHEGTGCVRNLRFFELVTL